MRKYGLDYVLIIVLAVLAAFIWHPQLEWRLLHRGQTLPDPEEVQMP